MLIVTQDRKSVVNFDNCACVYVHEGCLEAESSKGRVYTLGEYNDPEEVLGELVELGTSYRTVWMPEKREGREWDIDEGECDD